MFWIGVIVCDEAKTFEVTLEKKMMKRRFAGVIHFKKLKQRKKLFSG